MANMTSARAFDIGNEEVVSFTKRLQKGKHPEGRATNRSGKSDSET